jgi:selenocysteine lyase/cysteine desulfurase
LTSIDEIFKSRLPDNLYFDHYSLSDLYPEFTAQEWRAYLRDNATFIDSEMAAMVEPAARAAIKRLGNASSSEVQALKSLMETSKLINDAQKQQTKVVLTFIPPTNNQPKETQQHDSE